MNFWNRSLRMFNLNSDLLSGATSWDTNYARTYLQIPKDQLEKINKIPGWSKTVPEKEKTTENVEKHATQQTSIQNILTTITNISTKDDNDLKIQDHNSDSQSKAQSISKKEMFLKNVSLSPSKKNNAYLLKRSSSLPDLHQEFQPHNKSEELSRKRTHSIGKDISSSTLSPLSKTNLSNETYTAPLLSDDGVNPIKLLGHKSFSCHLNQTTETLRQTLLKTLDNTVFRHKHLKDGVYIKSDVRPHSTEEAVPYKLLQLEKRLSPSKEMYPTVEVEDIIIYGQEAIEMYRNKRRNLLASKSHESLESKPNSQSLNDKSDASVKDGATDISKIAISNFDSSHSPEIPCGQPVPTEVPSQSELFPSQESSKLSAPEKLHNDSPSVPCKQSLPIEVACATEPPPSQKLAKLNSPSKSQNAKLLDNKMVPEKTGGTFSVFSASSNEKATDVVFSKESGTKRKRRSRSEKLSKKLDTKRTKRVDIQFSSAQIKSMLEIMKIFHTEV